MRPVPYVIIINLFVGCAEQTEPLDEYPMSLVNSIHANLTDEFWLPKITTI